MRNGCGRFWADPVGASACSMTRCTWSRWPARPGSGAVRPPAAPRPPRRDARAPARCPPGRGMPHRRRHSRPVGPVGIAHWRIPLAPCRHRLSRHPRLRRPVCAPGTFCHQWLPSRPTSLRPRSTRRRHPGARRVCRRDQRRDDRIPSRRRYRRRRSRPVLRSVPRWCTRRGRS